MKWYTQIIIAYMCIAGWAWIGTDFLPPENNPYMNMSQNSSLPRQLFETIGLYVGNHTSGEVGPSEEAWLTANASRQAELMTTNPGGILGIAAEGLSAFLGSAYGATIGYMIGLVDALSRFTGAMTILLYMMGIPQPWGGFLGAMWNILFIIALMSLITGRDT